jgi:hypothetical protein
MSKKIIVENCRMCAYYDIVNFTPYCINSDYEEFTQYEHLLIDEGGFPKWCKLENNI